MKVKIERIHAVANWTWGQGDEVCGICRNQFDGCCPNCKLPGDDCPLISGECKHAFHLHCILQWLESQGTRKQCPMCRQNWRFQHDRDGNSPMESDGSV